MRTLYRERALLNINSNSKTQREKKWDLSLFFTQLYSSRPLNDADAEQKEKEKEKRERRRSVLLLLLLSCLSLRVRVRSLARCAISTGALSKGRENNETKKGGNCLLFFQKRSKP